MGVMNTQKRLLTSLRHAWSLGGARHVADELARKAGWERLSPAADTQRLQTEAAPEDILSIDWSGLANRRPRITPRGEPLRIAWLMSPPGWNSGGHQNIFRFISYLEGAGHTCEVFITSQIDHRTVSEVDQAINANYEPIDAPISRFGGSFNGADVVFATGWETCYPVARHLGEEIAMYFVSDFEPLFFPAGSAASLAENTYRMGFTAITAGPWLSKRLRGEYGQDAAAYSFGANTDLYQVTETERHAPGIFYYARPDTARRGFELGLLTLAELHRRRPDIVIHLAGQDLGNWEFDFPCVQHGALTLDELPALYNQCDAALVLSLTNLSLLPNELLACGVVPVMNDGPNTRMVCQNPNAIFSFCEPNALAAELIRAADGNRRVERRQELAGSVAGASWNEAGARFVHLVEAAAAGQTISDL